MTRWTATGNGSDSTGPSCAAAHLTAVARSERGPRTTDQAHHTGKRSLVADERQRRRVKFGRPQADPPAAGQLMSLRRRRPQGERLRTMDVRRARLVAETRALRDSRELLCTVIWLNRKHASVTAIHLRSGTSTFQLVDVDDVCLQRAFALNTPAAPISLGGRRACGGCLAFSCSDQHGREPPRHRMRTRSRDVYNMGRMELSGVG